MPICASGSTPEPSASTAMVATTPRNSIDGKNSDEMRCAVKFASRFSRLSSSKRARNGRSRRNDCTTAMPATDSAICAVTPAIRLRTSSCAAAERRWKRRVMTSAGGSTTSAISPSRQSLMNSAVTAAGSSTVLVTRVGRPCESTSEIASTSLVSRAMIHPARCSEK